MTGPRHYLGLDGLRGVCAVSIVLYHCDDLFHKGPIFQHGYLAVDIFFLLSGFVIALAHENRLRAQEGLGRFLKARARRLLPVFWIGATFNLAIFFAMAANGFYPEYGWTFTWLVVPVTTLLMLPAWGSPDGSFSPPMINVTWSLLVEWVVNIAYGALLFRLRTRTLVILAIAGWAVMSVLGYYTERGWCVGFQMLSLGMLRGFAAFLAGVVIWRLHRQGRFARLPALAPELLLTGWLAIAAVPTFTATPTFDWIAVTLLCPMLVLLLLRADHRAPAWFKGLGDLSYPLYVTHPGIILLAQKTPLFGLDKGPSAPRALGIFALCIGAGWIASRLARLRTGNAARARDNAGGNGSPELRTLAANGGVAPP
jgi:peptidoglycan/LPS O-acetylase OafA/YrhL